MRRRPQGIMEIREAMGSGAGDGRGKTEFQEQRSRRDLD
jgi:hypothetical protein